MKRFYRILALVLIAACLWMSGCVQRDITDPGKKWARLSEPVTAASIIEVMGRRLWSQQSAEFTIQASFEMDQNTGRGMQSMAMDVNFQGELITTAIRLHLSGDLGMNIMGMSMDFPMEIYAVHENDALTACLFAMGEWITESFPFDSDDLNEALSQFAGYSPSEESLSRTVLRDEKEMVGDRECFRLDYEIRGIEIDVPEGVPADQMEGFEDLVCIESYWVDAETVLPVRISASVEGPVGGAEFSFKKLELLVDFTGFGTVESITVPEEAFDSAEADYGTSVSL